MLTSFTVKRIIFTKATILCGLSFLFTALSGKSAELLEAGKPIILEGTHGRFDFLTIDAEGRRLLAAHTGNSSLDIIDLDKRLVTKVISTGAAQSEAVDAKSHRYYVGVSKPPQLVTIDSEKLEVVGSVPLSGPADLIAYNQISARVYVGHDDGKDLWVVDPSTKAVETIGLPSDGPEDLAFDSTGMRLFQAMKTGSVVAVIDLRSNKVTDQWSTAPAKGPHGMAVDEQDKSLLIAGANGKLVMMRQGDGKVTASAEIAERVDQIAYDPELHRVYCASGTGKIVIVQVENEKLTTLGSVASSEGARSIAVDRKTHTVWIAYAKGEASFVQPFAVTK